MKPSMLAFAVTLVLFVGTAWSAPVTTRTRDPLGTTFDVSVDWQKKLIIAELRDNPADLAGAALEEKLQLAVLYGSAQGCHMAQDGRTLIRKNIIEGQLHCRWFDQ